MFINQAIVLLCLFVKLLLFFLQIGKTQTSVIKQEKMHTHRKSTGKLKTWKISANKRKEPPSAMKYLENPSALWPLLLNQQVGMRTEESLIFSPPTPAPPLPWASSQACYFSTLHTYPCLELMPHPSSHTLKKI